MVEEDLRRIGSRIKKARVAKGLTQERLAEIMNLSVGYIGMLEYGKRTPRLEIFLKLISVLEVTADDILCETVDYVCKTRLGNYDQQLSNLPKEERERIFQIMDVFLKKD